MLSSQDSHSSDHVVSTNETGSASDVRSTPSHGGYENGSLSHDETQSDSDLEETQLPPRLLVEIDECGRPFGEYASKFATRAGELIRVHCPIDYKDWRLIPAAFKDQVWNTLMVTYYLLYISFYGLLHLYISVFIDQLPSYYLWLKKILRCFRENFVLHMMSLLSGHFSKKYFPRSFVHSNGSYALTF